MLQKIVKFALVHRGIIIALACVLLGYGIYSIVTARFDVYPDFIHPQLKIKTLAPGLSPRQVEQLVTTPIEQALAGNVGAQKIFSHSLQGISVVKVLFPSGSNILHDQQAVAVRLGQVAGQLPPGVHTPVLMPLASSIRWVTVVGITSPSNNLRHLRTVADWLMQPRLLAVPGVSEVAVVGGLQKDYQIRLIPRRLMQYRVSTQQVLAAARQASGLVGAEFITTPNQTLTLRVHGQAKSLEQLAATPVAIDGQQVVTLGDVAQVAIGHLPPVGASSINGQPGVLLMIGLGYGANLLEVTRGVQTALNDLKPALSRQGIDLHGKILQSADFITTALHNLTSALLIGSGLVLLVLVVFLGHWRTSLISCLAIPLSLVSAVAIMVHLGYTLNTMTLGGLAVAIGEVVDDAVIDVENILRRLRLNRERAEPRAALAVVLEASIEVRSAVVFATVAVVLVFLPIFGLSGLAGKFFAPLGIAYIAAVLSSLVLALTLTPALGLVLLPKVAQKGQEARATAWLKQHYRRLLSLVERWRTAVIFATAIITLGMLAGFPFLKTVLFPRLNERDYVLHLDLVSGASLAQSIAIGNRVTAALRKIPYVEEVAQHAGRSALAGDVVGPQYSAYFIKVRPLSPAQATKFRAAMDGVLKQFPGVLLYYNTELSERVNETISGSGAPVVVQLAGNDFTALQEASARVTAVLKTIPGARSVAPQTAWNAPEVKVRLRRGPLQRWGLTPLAVLHYVQLLVHGQLVGRLYHGTRIWPLTMLFQPRWSAGIAQIQKLPIQTPGGQWIPLAQVARVYEAPGFYSISHLDGQRAQVISVHLTGTSAGPFVRRAQRAIARLTLPPGVIVSFAGSAQRASRAMHELLFHSAIALAGIVLLLFMVLGHWQNVVLLLINLPLALAGGVAAAWVTGGVLSLGAMVGFVTLFGITLRNAIMLLSHYQHLVQVEGHLWNIQTSIEGAVDRMPAILMTALVTALGLVPLAFASGSAGREIEGPLAQVILGGLATSTLLNLLILPTLALRFGRFLAGPQES